MEDEAVINASPLIFLSRGKHLDLLQHVARRLLVPEPVAKEVRAKGAHDITAQDLERVPWLEMVPGEQIPAEILAWGLGRGESAVLALAQARGRSAILDDLAGRKCAASLGIPVYGTLGIVLSAKRNGHISSARGILEDLIRGGLYLSSATLNQALERVGE